MILRAAGLTLDFLTFQCRFAKCCLLLRVELIPQLFTIKHKERRINMTRNRQILLDLIEFGSFNRGKGIFLPINGLRLQRSEDLSKGHRRRVCTQSFEGVKVHGALHDTQFDSVKVFDFANRPAAVGQIAKAIFPVA